MPEAKRYVPILKWKSGEQIALAHLRPEHKTVIIPFLELVNPQTPAEILKQLEGCYDFPVYIDTSMIDQEDEQHLTTLMQEAKNAEKEIYPVVYYEDFTELADQLSNLTNRMLLRVSVPEEIDGPDYSTIFSKVVNWKQGKQVFLDVMLDLYVLADERKAKVLYSELKSVINKHLATNPVFDRVIIAMTCFPENLSSLPSGESKFFKRYEIKIFQKLLHEVSNDHIKSRLLFSDYGVTKFTDTDIDFSQMRYGPLPKIRYTTPEHYWVLKGAKNRVTDTWIRSRQDMASEILNSKYYYGENFSFGDLEIKERALEKKGPGNNTNWVAIDANHHITVVIEELSKLFGS